MINWTNITDFAQIPALANTHGPFWAAMLYMIWIISFIILLNWGWDTALMVSSFVCLVLGLMLVYAGDLIAWWHCMVFVGVILFVFLYIMYINDSPPNSRY